MDENRKELFPSEKLSPAITNNLSTKTLTIFTQIPLNKAQLSRQLWFTYFFKQSHKLLTTCFPKKPQTLFTSIGIQTWL